MARHKLAAGEKKRGGALRRKIQYHAGRVEGRGRGERWKTDRPLGEGGRKKENPAERGGDAKEKGGRERE